MLQEVSELVKHIIDDLETRHESLCDHFEKVGELGIRPTASIQRMCFIIECLFYLGSSASLLVQKWTPCVGNFTSESLSSNVLLIL